jgi:nitrite reductase/ring-hydroxylating ferredoxin subunit
VQTAQRSSSSAWQPVLPSHELRPAENIVLGFAAGAELALWRSREGVVQAWENRCPHRGTRLTLGRIVQGARLACAYHGWEFEPDGAKCSAIPALPQGPVPRDLCVKTYHAAEAHGMVWVAAAADAANAPPPAAPSGFFFCRSLGVRCAAGDAAEVLQSHGFSEAARCVWVGELAPSATTMTIYLTHAQAQLTLLHAWLAAPPPLAQVPLAMAALRRLRDSIEVHCASASVA